MEKTIEDRLEPLNCERTIEGSLRGQPPIGHTIKLDKPEGVRYGLEADRKCGACLYRIFDENPDGDCYTPVNTNNTNPHELFGFKPNEFLPMQIEGKEVGNYCPCFVYFLEKKDLKKKVK